MYLRQLACALGEEIRRRMRWLPYAKFARQFGIPFEAIAYVFGRNPMYWYRIYLSLGRASIVGTTIKDPQKLPQNLVADEKHTWLGKNRVALPTTVAIMLFFRSKLHRVC